MTHDAVGRSLDATLPLISSHLQKSTTRTHHESRVYDNPAAQSSNGKSCCDAELPDPNTIKRQTTDWGRILWETVYRNANGCTRPAIPRPLGSLRTADLAVLYYAAQY